MTAVQLLAGLVVIGGEKGGKVSLLTLVGLFFCFSNISQLNNY